MEREIRKEDLDRERRRGERRGDGGVREREW